MPEERFEERTEPATPRKREEARERGHVARSLDLETAIVLLSALLGFFLFGKQLVSGMIGSMAYLFETLDQATYDRENLAGLLAPVISLVAASIIPFMLLVLAGAVAGNVLQVGLIWTTTPLEPDLSRLDPVAGFFRLFRLRNFVRVGFGLLKVLAVGAVLGYTIWSERAALIDLLEHDFESIVQYLMAVTFVLALRAAIALLILGVLDYAYQRFQYERDLRMSPFEIKEELRRYEGDPKIKERRRALHRQVAYRRMLQRVPKATVVITNPTHFAVALQYEIGKHRAPTVVAKGADYLAQRIREIATENGVPIVEKPELARALYKACEVDQEIPLELYQAVAEVLAYVYRLKRTGARMPAAA